MITAYALFMFIYLDWNSYNPRQNSKHGGLNQTSAVSVPCGHLLGKG